MREQTAMREIDTDERDNQMRAMESENRITEFEREMGDITKWLITECVKDKELASGNVLSYTYKRMCAKVY